MKKIVTLFIMMLAASYAQANDKFIADHMKTMRDGMVEIQDGFFYNQVDKIEDGISQVEKAFDVDKTKLLPKSKAHMVGMVSHTSTRIEDSLAKMKKLVEQKKYAPASDEYAKLVTSCTFCHKVIRGW